MTLESTTEDEELLVIPENLALFFSNSNIKLDGDVNDKVKALGPWFSLMLAMIYEYLQNGASRWHQYLQILPISFNTLMFWTDVELKELQGSSIVGKIGKRDADETITNQILPIVIEHPDLFPPPMGISSFDHPDGKAKILELAHRMGSLIMAYAFDVERPEDEEEADEDGFIADDEDEPTGKAMVPLADMLKPDADNNVSFPWHLFFTRLTSQGSTFARGWLFHHENYKACRTRRGAVPGLWRNTASGVSQTIWLHNRQSF